jgi:glucokinase
MDKFVFINDFIAAGYGVSVLGDKDVESIDGSAAKRQDGPNSVKVIIGPGTGMGQGLLVKGPEAESLYNPYPTEGGHSDFSIRSEEDFKLFKFAQDYIPNSKNIEN